MAPERRRRKQSSEEYVTPIWLGCLFQFGATTHHWRRLYLKIKTITQRKMMLNNKEVQAIYEEQDIHLLNRAIKIAGLDHARDIVNEAWANLLAKRIKEKKDPDNWESALNQYVDWAAINQLRRQAQIEDLSSQSQADENEEEGDLGDEDALVNVETSQNRTAPAWPTAIERDTPEQNLLASELRDRIRDLALLLCSERDYAIFLAVTMDGVPQWRVAKEFGMTQQNVSQVVARVRSTLADALREEGYAI
jgi:RNA polymerase sigma factor (sigma-70 family)